MNPGKSFEEDFKNSCLRPNVACQVSIDRLKDTQSGMRGDTTICDFIVYRKPYQHYFELKSYHAQSIPIDAIRPHQLKGLLAKSVIRGVSAGVLLNYRVPVNKVLYMPITAIDRMISSGTRSIHHTDAIHFGIELLGELKRTRYEYNVIRLLDAISGRIEHGERNSERDWFEDGESKS